MNELARSISIAGLSRDPSRTWSGSARRAIDWVASIGASSIQLDGTMEGLRARELDRSARRDLAATLRRMGLMLSGIDLWVPPRHFADASHQDRATGAVLDTISLASELTSLRAGAAPCVVSALLPASAAVELVQDMLGAAERAGVVLADHLHPARADALMPVGIDPAVVLATGDDPGEAVTRAGERLASARLSDASPAGRVPVGSPEGQLDVLAYEVALSVAGYSRPLIVDLRGLGDRQARAAEEALEK